MNHSIKVSSSQKKLNFKSRALLKLLTSQPNRKWSKEQVYEETCYSYYVIEKVVKQLKALGYLRFRPRSERGRFAGHIWEVTETPWEFHSDSTTHGVDDKAGQPSDASP